MWQERLQPLIDAGKLTVIGIAQEQDGSRANLYRQWRQLSWPIAVDSFNLLGLSTIPRLVALDESGVVRATGVRTPDAIATFLAEEYPKTRAPHNFEELSRGTFALSFVNLPDKEEILRLLATNAQLAWLISNPKVAVPFYTEALKRRPTATSYFRLGVVLRGRADSIHWKPGDAQAASDAWTEALKRNPNQYIWRRRLQQYGPRLDKPYDFYSWVAQARQDIRARGEEPARLWPEPAGSEIAPPARGPADTAVMKNLDAKGKIVRDDGRIRIETVVTPSRVRPGSAVRVRLHFRVDENTKPYWNNEADGLQLYVQVPEGCALREGVFDYPLPKQAETQEDRLLEFELTTPGTGSGTLELQGYALYDVCDREGGTCLRLRQDFSIPLTLDPEAPKLK